MKLALSTVFDCFNYPSSFSNNDFSSFKFDQVGETGKKWHTKSKIKMSQLTVQIYELLNTALRTKARVVHDLLHIALQTNQSKLNKTTNLSHWYPSENRLVLSPRAVRGAMHSGKKKRSELWLNAMHSGKK